MRRAQWTQRSPAPCTLRGPDLYVGLRDAVCAKPALPDGPSCPPSSPPASPQQPGHALSQRTAPAGAPQTPVEGIHRQLAGPPRPAPTRGAEELCPCRAGVTQVALPDPRPPLPPSRAWPWFSTSPHGGSQARKQLELGPASSSQSRLSLFPGHWGPLSADLRPSPAPPARSLSGSNR